MTIGKLNTMVFHNYNVNRILLVVKFIISMSKALRQCYDCMCSNKAKFPDPYNFQFCGKNPILQNSIDFQSNFVKTSKYTWYSFLPISLLYQFKRLANIYFLVIAILQTISIISPLNPLTAWAPLVVVLGISMIREGYEDYQRYKSDKQLNHQTMTQVRRNGRFQEVVWSDVIIGEICKVEQQQLFPADLILLNSSAEGGVAFIQTASLDGQKNLKPRSAFKRTTQFAKDEYLDEFVGTWKGIVPDKELHKFSSTMKVGDETIVYEGDKQLLYRGARLKNTKWVYGLVIYTGKNTKIMMNSDSSSQKMSQVQRKVNKVLGIILLFQVILCFLMAILYGTSRARLQDKIDYLQWPQMKVGADAVLIFFTYFVLINTMIPISLVVSIQIVKVSQSYFINKDKMMYSEFRKKYVQVKTASLNQQLGQIEYVFSDKTGTLTMNLMEFKIAVIGSKMYGDLGLIINDPMRPPQVEKGFRDDALFKLIQGGRGDERLPQSITVKGGATVSFNTQKQLAEEYLLALATAHEVVAQKDEKTKKLKYQGPSPDEITLVDAAKDMNFQFIKSTQSTTTVSIRGAEKTFDLLEVFPFTSDRKRMSVVIREANTIKMYTKGADSIIKARLSPDQTLNLDAQLTKFSRIGLRTLLIAMRTISDSEYNVFKKEVAELPNQNREAAMEELVSRLQKGLYLIGATAVLDRLQDFVPQTIRDLIRANIKVWMLTGDKMETAENIAKSCNLIQNHFEILRYSFQRQEEILPNLRKLVMRAQNLSQDGHPKALMIEGADLTPVLASDEGQTQLANLAKNCEAVVCCRLLPLQKAQVVDVVRRKLNKITLSIGDGANDVPMIKTAHIGIGLFGQEGMGAVQASDYALPQFRMLWRLLLVHGRWNYIRISEMILYFFYKNMLFTVPQIIIAFYCGFSGQSLFDDWFISFYNLFFTSLPLVIRAILEQDVNYVFKKSDQISPQSTMSNLMKNKRDLVLERQNKYLPSQFGVNKFFYRLFPKIYFIGQQNCIFNYTNFFLWVIEAFVEAILISLFCIYIIGNVSINSMGYNSDLWLVGITTFSCVILVVTFKLATHTKFWSGFLFIAVTFLSLALYLAYMWIANSYFSTYIKGTTYVAWTSIETYLTVLFCITLILFVDGIVVHIDFMRGGYSSKMRSVVEAEKMDNRSYYDHMSLRMTDGLTEMAKTQNQE